MNKILVICPEPSLRLFYAAELMEEGYEVATADREPIAGLIEREWPDLVVLDHRDLGDQEVLVKAIRKERNELPVIFGRDRVHLKSDRNRYPQTDYFIKGTDLEGLKIKVKRLLRPQTLPVENMETLIPFSNAPASQLNLDLLHK
ncbi:MAG: response regulator [Desulfobacteraceae bacterium]|nr:MAG: response regulator [Desulfobacteraceae bacterium]